jgi:dephospho-CoA kinase
MDLDVIAKEEQESPLGLAQIAEAFGSDVVVDGGTALDRALLAQRAFVDGEQARLLNSICWPPVMERLGNYLTMSSCQPMSAPDWLVVEIPMLVEALGADGSEQNLALGGNLVDLADDFLLVDAPEQLRVERAVARGMSEVDARARIALQATDSQRQGFAVAHNATIVDNSGSLDCLHRQLDAWYADRILGRLF